MKGQLGGDWRRHTPRAYTTGSILTVSASAIGYELCDARRDGCYFVATHGSRGRRILSYRRLFVGLRVRVLSKGWGSLHKLGYRGARVVFYVILVCGPFCPCLGVLSCGVIPDDVGG